MFDDPIVVIAALAGGLLGLLLMIRLGWWRTPTNESAQVSEPRVRPTGYSTTHRPSAAPVLGAGALGTAGLGLALAPVIGVLSLFLLGIGAVLFAFAARDWLREGREPDPVDASDGQHAGLSDEIDDLPE